MHFFRPVSIDSFTIRLPCNRMPSHGSFASLPQSPREAWAMGRCFHLRWAQFRTPQIPTGTQGFGIHISRCIKGNRVAQMSLSSALGCVETILDSIRLKGHIQVMSLPRASTRLKDCVLQTKVAEHSISNSYIRTFIRASATHTHTHPDPKHA